MAFGEKIKEGLTEKRDFLGINEHYFATQGNLHKMGNRLLKEQLTTLATKVGAFIIMPVIVLGVVAKSDRFDLALTGVVIYAVLLAFWILARTAKAVVRHFHPTPDIKRRFLALWSEMAQVYSLLRGPIINPSMLRSALMTAHEHGAVWDASIHAMIDRIVARDPAVWIVSEEFGYRS